MGTIVLLDLMGGVALLLWGLHMVQSGILRAFGAGSAATSSRNAFGNRFSALGCRARASRRFCRAVPRRGLMTGVLRRRGSCRSRSCPRHHARGPTWGRPSLFSFFRSTSPLLAPVLFVIGLVSFRSGARTRAERRRVAFAIGLGLMLLALHILLNTLAPAESAPSVRALLNVIAGDPVLCVIIAAWTYLGRALQRRDRVVDHVAGIFTLRVARIRNCARA